MGVPRLAKHAAGIDDAAAGSIPIEDIDLESVADDIIIKQAAGKEFQVEDAAGGSAITSDQNGLVAIPELVAATSMKIVYGHHAGVALADLTAAFGAPAAGRNGEVMIYKNDTDAKVYVVIIANATFAIEELTVVAA